MFRQLRQYTVSLFFVSLLVLGSSVFASPVSSSQAKQAIQGWFNLESDPMGMAVSDSLSTVEKLKNDGAPFYVVNFSGGGFAVVSSDDELEPIIAFSSKGNFQATQGTPLWDMVSKDIKERFNSLSSTTQKTSSKTNSIEKTKWNSLISAASKVAVKSSAVSSVSDVRVPPLIQSQWNQTTHNNYTPPAGKNCFNYYTPNNYPSGCVATAMAQIMRHYQYPTAGIGSISFGYTVNTVPQTAYTLGGDNFGGPYNWANMPLIPAIGVTTAQQQAIGALCHDAGIAVHMAYTSSYSGAYMSDALTALSTTFGFSGASMLGSDTTLGNGLFLALDTNLDAHKPLIISVVDASSYGGHAVVADGYGYNSGTRYYHLNMGWGGFDDLWYNLPDISGGASGYTFDLVDRCIYNISTLTAGQIISGRIVDEFSNPIGGVTITADDGVTQYTAVSRMNGVFAIDNLASNTDFVVTVDGTGTSPQLYYMSKHVRTGAAGSWDNDSGNVSVSDLVGFHMSLAACEIAQDLTCPQTSSIAITLACDDDGYDIDGVVGIPGYIQYEITVLPERGSLKEPGGSYIRSVPYVVQNASHQVVYTNEDGLSCEDGFKFVAKDALFGTLIQANMPNINIDVPFISEGFGSGLPSGWSIIDGLTDGYKWGWYGTTNIPNTYWDNQIYLADGFGVSAQMNESLVTNQLMMFPESLGIKLKFNHVYNVWPGSFGCAAAVEITADGMNWQAVAAYTANVEASEEIDLPLGALMGPNVRIRFNFQDQGDSFWGIDNVEFVEKMPTAVKRGDLDHDNDIDSQDLQNFASAWLVNANGDLDFDGDTDILDLAIISTNWLSLPFE